MPAIGQAGLQVMTQERFILDDQQFHKLSLQSTSAKAGCA
jgi:hypothetical protein